MEHKAFKQDLTYACKKFQKEGKILSVFADNLVINDEGKFLAEGDHLCPLEMLVLIKGWAPSLEMMRTHKSYNIYVTDLVAQEAQIALSDVYAFLKGLENFAMEGNNEFYNVGTYIREKFSPVGARPELTHEAIWRPAIVARQTFKKFVIHSIKGNTSIMEVEAYRLPPSECPFPSMREGEWAARILAPQALYDKDRNNKLVPSVWMDRSFYETAGEAYASLKKGTYEGIIRSKSKRKLQDPTIIVEATDEEVDAIMSKVKTVLL